MSLLVAECMRTLPFLKSPLSMNKKCLLRDPTWYLFANDIEQRSAKVFSHPFRSGERSTQDSTFSQIAVFTSLHLPEPYSHQPPYSHNAVKVKPTNNLPSFILLIPFTQHQFTPPLHPSLPTTHHSSTPRPLLHPAARRSVARLPKSSQSNRGVPSPTDEAFLQSDRRSKDCRKPANGSRGPEPYG